MPKHHPAGTPRTPSHSAGTPRTPRILASAALAAGLQLLGSSAFAHIELQLPLNRYSDSKSGENKSCPCGAGSSNRRCNRPIEFSDPNRSEDRITTFAPGDTIKVRFDEYVAHSGRYRIAFDPDGASLDRFNENILLDEPDPTGKLGNTGTGSIWEFEVTLPDMECENCSLQLIQVMDMNTTDPVLNPVDRGGTYFQCADIRLVAGTPAGGIAPPSPTPHLGGLAIFPTESPTPATASDAVASSEMTTPAPMVGSNTSNGAMKTSEVAPAMNMDSSEAGGGCSLSGARPQRAGSAMAVFSTALAALALSARRRLARRSLTRGRGN